MSDRSVDIDTARLSPERARELRASGNASPMMLLVYHHDGLEAVPLARAEAVTIGRGSDATITIDDVNLSRLHARFELGSAKTVAVTDLGSTNGTMFEGELVSQVQLEPGDAVALGGVLVVVQPRGALDATRAQGHDGLRLAIEREVARAHYLGGTFALLRVRCRDVHVSQWRQAVAERLRPIDLLGVYSADTLEVLAPSIDAASAKELARALVAHHEAKPLTCGVATFPRSGTTAEALIAACARALRRATPNAPVGEAEASDARSGTDVTSPIAASPVTRELFETAERIAASRIPVLLCGETGTGKEVVARAIHRRGPRRDKPMLSVNCGALSPNLVESTLFGHEKGAFTGALKSAPGIFVAASGGTVLLDEIGELPAPAQAALLRVLENKRVMPVGSPQEVEVDVRVVAATHRDLEAMCDEGSFRRDLFFRLNAMTLLVPPLRDRIEELESLAVYFFGEAIRENERALEGIDDDAIATMKRYDWPGNLRELRNVIERAVIIARGTRVNVEDLPLRMRRLGPKTKASPETAEPDLFDEGPIHLKSTVQAYEASVIRQAMDRCDGNRREMARLLDIPQRTLAHKIKLYKLA